MQVKERSPLLTQGITRRQFVSSLAFLSLFGATADGIYRSTRSMTDILSLSEFMKDFNRIDQKEFEMIVGSVQKKELAVNENGSFIIENDPVNVFLKATGFADPLISLSVMEVSIDEADDTFKLPIIQPEDKKYLIPLINSEELYSTTLNLGKQEPGEHKAKIKPTKYTEEIPDYLTMELFTLSSNHPVMQTILDLIPKLSPKPNVFKYQHIPNDILLYIFADIRKNKDGVYLATYSFIASSEDDGSSPDRLLKGQGRTADVEWFFRQKIAGDGTPLDRVFQTQGHRAGAMLNSLPAEFHVSTGNNMVAKVLAGEKIVSLLPEFLPTPLRGNDIIRKYKALQVLSYRELLYERRMKLDDFSIQQFIHEHLGDINLLTFDLPWPPPMK